MSAARLNEAYKSYTLARARVWGGDGDGDHHANTQSWVRAVVAATAWVICSLRLLDVGALHLSGSTSVVQSLIQLLDARLQPHVRVTLQEYCSALRAGLAVVTDPWNRRFLERVCDVVEEALQTSDARVGVEMAPQNHDAMWAELRAAKPGEATSHQLHEAALARSCSVEDWIMHYDFSKA